MYRVLTLPGISGSGPQHWQTLWEQADPLITRVEAPDWERPDREAWIDALERAVEVSGPATLLAAHSLGCLQVVHWAARSRLRVRGALLVAPPDPAGPFFPAVAASFSPVPRRPLPFRTTVVASSNDPYSSLAYARACAHEWGGKLVDIGAAGHVNAETGLGWWNEGMLLLLELSGERK